MNCYDSWRSGRSYDGNSTDYGMIIPIASRCSWFQSCWAMGGGSWRVVNPAAINPSTNIVIKYTIHGIYQGCISSSDASCLTCCFWHWVLTLFFSRKMLLFYLFGDLEKKNIPPSPRDNRSTMVDHLSTHLRWTVSKKVYLPCREISVTTGSYWVIRIFGKMLVYKYVLHKAHGIH